jgi:DUF4097 and DUF4098 domain-containing protein YvlB
MPTFDTPEPISVTMDLVVSDARITASERADTVVEVRPSDESNERDVKAAEQTRVEYSDGKLLVKTPKLHTYFSFSYRVGAIDVTIELPAGSHVHGDTSMGEFHCAGQLGDCGFKTGTGGIRLDHTGALRLNTGSGKITVNRVVGHAEVSTGSGEVRIREIDGTALIKSSNGDTWVGEVTGDLRSHAANGDISVDRAHAAVTAKTANGNVRIGEVVRGEVVLNTASGELEVGIREGTAAWLDVKSWSGRVHNSLDTSDGPDQSDETVKVRARTYSGDIVIRRS